MYKLYEIKENIKFYTGKKDTVALCFRFNYTEKNISYLSSILHLWEHLICDGYLPDATIGNFDACQNYNYVYLIFRKINIVENILKTIINKTKLDNFFSEKLIEKESTIINNEDYYRVVKQCISEDNVKNLLEINQKEYLSIKNLKNKRKLLSEVLEELNSITVFFNQDIDVYLMIKKYIENLEFKPSTYDESFINKGIFLKSNFIMLDQKFIKVGKVENCYDILKTIINKFHTLSTLYIPVIIGDYLYIDYSSLTNSETPHFTCFSEFNNTIIEKPVSYQLALLNSINSDKKIETFNEIDFVKIFDKKFSNFGFYITRSLTIFNNVYNAKMLSITSDQFKEVLKNIKFEEEFSLLEPDNKISKLSIKDQFFSISTLNNSIIVFFKNINFNYIGLLNYLFDKISNDINTSNIFFSYKNLNYLTLTYIIENCLFNPNLNLYSDREYLIVKYQKSKTKVFTYRPGTYKIITPFRFCILIEEFNNKKIREYYNEMYNSKVLLLREEALVYSVRTKTYKNLVYTFFPCLEPEKIINIFNKEKIAIITSPFTSETLIDVSYLPEKRFV